MLLPVVAGEFEALGGLMFLLIGVAALGIGRDPNGVASRLFTLGRWRPTAKVTVPFRRAAPAYATGTAAVRDVPVSEAPVSSVPVSATPVSPAAEVRASREGKW